MPLFKYVTLDRIDILVNQEIRYTQLGAFNDPFEMPVFLEKMSNLSTSRATIWEQFRQDARLAYEKLEPAEKKKKQFNEFLSELTKDITEDNFNQVFEEANKKYTPIMRDVLQRAVNAWVVLSLTETHENLLMWSHYAEKHTGMVIEFVEEHPIFYELKIPPDNPRFFQNVRYTSDRPVWGTMDEKNVHDLILTKSKEWEYEQELRFTRRLNDAQRVISAAPHDICLFSMPASAIKRVILGARVNPEDRDSIKNTLRTTPHLRHIRLQQASLDERRFALNFVDY